MEHCDAMARCTQEISQSTAFNHATPSAVVTHPIGSGKPVQKPQPPKSHRHPPTSPRQLSQGVTNTFLKVNRRGRKSLHPLQLISTDSIPHCMDHEKHWTTTFTLLIAH
ncbi:hypothetical protein TNIN_252851 [Trichonephila inaurata madagascariensis]|uniref:Uncharacterized protein n=1 Tax=Trichonephila inaurata madagascariensis TaxID=2747483 RepID=A0A8X6XN00_9ARAC|nr:hypothetical protein TNIN_252851 [Trichonephila inaurata madagascariensis]